MEPTQWTLSETFQFPAEYGKAVSAQDVKVTAGYTEHPTEDAVRLSGIYHVTANVEFDGEAQETTAGTDAVMIDDVEVEDKSGYFEYAVPLLVDFPSNGGKLEAGITDASATATDDGNLIIMWTVEATQEEPEQLVTEAAAEAEEENMATAHYDDDSSSSERFNTVVDYVSDNEMLAFISDLEDDVTVTTFRLNDVFVE